MAVKRIIPFLLMIFLPLAGGCVVLQKNIPKPAESPVERYAADYLYQGRSLEDKGDPAAALKQYALALTVSPLNAEALAGRDRMRQVLDRSAAAHYQKGLSLNEQGKYDLASKEFLKALQLQPGHLEALKMLTSRERFEIKRYVLHKIKPGESLATVAQSYYGDHQKFPLIAKYNRISDAAKIMAGQTLKIPEIEGLPFPEKALEVKAETQIQPDYDLGGLEEYRPEAEQEQELEEPQTDQDRQEEQVALYLDSGIILFQDQRYQEALEEFAKVLRVYPKNDVAADYLFRSHLQLAQNLLKQQEYLSASAHFREALRYKQGCQACRKGILASENLYKEYHYKKGFQYFGNEELLAAIEEWELVMALDPDYKRTNELIQKAQTILKNIDAIRATENSETAP